MSVSLSSYLYCLYPSLSFSLSLLFPLLHKSDDYGMLTQEITPLTGSAACRRHTMCALVHKEWETTDTYKFSNSLMQVIKQVKVMKDNDDAPTHSHTSHSILIPLHQMYLWWYVLKTVEYMYHTIKVTYRGWTWTGGQGCSGSWRRFVEECCLWESRSSLQSSHSRTEIWEWAPAASGCLQGPWGHTERELSIFWAPTVTVTTI